MSFTWRITGSCWMRSKKADRRSTSWSSRASVAARSKRNPSTCISVTHDRGRPQRRVGPALLDRDVGMAGGDALHVGLVDDRLVPRHPRRTVVGPVEEGTGDDRAGHVGRAVVVVAREVVLGVADVVREDG